MKRERILRLVVLAAVAGSCVVGFLFLPYPNTVRQKEARQFIELLQDEKFDDAFAMTNQTAAVGTTLEVFKEISHRQFGYTRSDGDLQIKLTSIHPPQTYGNRLRRWISGRDVDQETLSLDFEIKGLHLYRLFEVRFARGSKDAAENSGAWKISYFQSHAG